MPVGESGEAKMNNSLLQEEEYVNLITQLAVKLVKEEVKDQDPRLTWDVMKMQLRRETIDYSIRRSKKKKKHRAELMEEIQTLERELSETEHPSDELTGNYHSLKDDWEALEKEKLNAAIMRSKARWTEEGEKNTKFFLNLEKHNQELKQISTLIDKEESLISNPKDVMAHIRSFYKDLYAPKEYGDLIDNPSYQLFKSEVKLDNVDVEMLDKHISENDIYEALTDLPGGKTPGLDGLTVEFYRKFWVYLKDSLLKCIDTVYANGQLSNDQKQGVINLIPKPDKDLRYIKNWRPISILNVDYKLITKALANRVKLVLPSLINYDQCGYVLDRLMGENVRIVNDLILYCRDFAVEGLLVFLDFEKAFDSLSWQFVDHTLTEFGFGEKFRTWIQCLYNKITSSILNNGNLSQSFELKRGI